MKYIIMLSKNIRINGRIACRNFYANNAKIEFSLAKAKDTIIKMLKLVESRSRKCHYIQ